MPAIISIVKSICIFLSAAAAVLSASQMDYSNKALSKTNPDLPKLPALTLKIAQVRFSPDSNSIAILAGDRMLSNWPAAGGNPIAHTLIASLPLTCLEWDTTGNHLYVGTSKAQVLQCDPKTLEINSKIRSEFDIINQLNSIGQSESLLSFGNIVNSQGKLSQSTLKLWHNDIHRNIENIPDLHYICAGRQEETGIFAFGASTGEIVLADLFSNSDPVILVKMDSAVECLKWSGRNLVATSEGTLHLIDSSKRECLKSIQISTKPIRHIEISKDEKTMFIAAGSESVQVRNAVSGELICKLASVNEMVSTITLSPDGKTLAVGTCQGNVTLWNTSDYQIKTIIPAGIN